MNEDGTYGLNLGPMPLSIGSIDKCTGNDLRLEFEPICAKLSA